MGRTLKLNHRLRIDILGKKANFSKLDEYLERLSNKGFDVAGVPFRVVDDMLARDSAPDFAAALPLTRHTVGGQPRLLSAVLGDLGSDSVDKLDRIVADASAHPMTRFEAMGWANFVSHNAAFPRSGNPTQDVFQFWDSRNPPSEVLEGKRLWQSTANVHVWYDDSLAFEFIAEGFGKLAADEYSKLWHPALKSDVFRLYRLVKTGGVYCDADSKPEHRAKEFLGLAGNRVWASSMTNVPNCVTNNWFIAAPPQNTLIAGLLDQVLRNVRDVASRGIFWLSGPGAFTTFLYQNSGTFDVGLLAQGCLKSAVFRQFDATYKRTEKNWRVYEHGLGLGNEAGLERALANSNGF